MTDDLISRRAAIEAILRMSNSASVRDLYEYVQKHDLQAYRCQGLVDAIDAVIAVPSAQPERLTDDDFETIRIHLNAYKEKLCNQQRWEEADEYQRIIDRFMAFASAQPGIVRCKDCKHRAEIAPEGWHPCNEVPVNDNWFCADGERREE